MFLILKIILKLKTKWDNNIGIKLKFKDIIGQNLWIEEWNDFYCRLNQIIFKLTESRRGFYEVK